MVNLGRKSNDNAVAPNNLARNVSGWLIMLPSLILFAFFIWEPLLASVQLSFYSTKGMMRESFVGMSIMPPLVKTIF